MSSPAPTSELPPRLELECLKILWRLGDASVRNIQAELSTSKPLAYTTVMTIMDRLARRGCVHRTRSGRSFVYSAILSREVVRRLAVREVVDSVFDGSETCLRTWLHHHSGD